MRKGRNSSSVRWFVPGKSTVGDTLIPTQVRFWVWTLGYGVLCVYLDGTFCKSDYSLREVLGRPVECHEVGFAPK